MKRLILVLGLLLSIGMLYSQTLNLSGVKHYITQINFEKRSSGRQEIKRSDTNLVSIGFFQDFSDTIDLYVNDVLAFHRYIYHDSDLVSTDYTGEDYTSDYKNKVVNIITIVYKNSHKYVQFAVDKQYPYYTIHAYYDICYIAGRKYQMMIK